MPLFSDLEMCFRWEQRNARSKVSPLILNAVGSANILFIHLHLFTYRVNLCLYTTFNLPCFIYFATSMWISHHADAMAVSCAKTTWNMWQHALCYQFTLSNRTRSWVEIGWENKEWWTGDLSGEKTVADAEVEEGVSRRKMPDQSGQDINKWWWANFVQSLRPPRESSKINSTCLLFLRFDPMKEL